MSQAIVCFLIVAACCWVVGGWLYGVAGRHRDDFGLGLIAWVVLALAVVFTVTGLGLILGRWVSTS